MLTPYLKKLIKREDLTPDESRQALELILTAQNPEQIAAFLALIRAKGESAAEMVAFVQVMQHYQINLSIDKPVLDMVGTGGDGARTVNISTGAALLAAACGVPVLKHGNRAVSSQAGAADVLQALGLDIEQSTAQIIDAVQTYGFGFCFAPNFHPKLLAVKPIRQQLKIPTLFNLLGPLLNPAQAKFYLLGVYDPKLLPLMADILLQLNCERAMVVHGNGLDELNCLGPCEVIEIKEKQTKHYFLDPETLGLMRCGLEDLQGGTAQENAALLRGVFQNHTSPLMDTLILNAAAAVYTYGLSDSIQAALLIVRENIANGKALRLLEEVTHA